MSWGWLQCTTRSEHGSWRLITCSPCSWKGSGPLPSSRQDLRCSVILCKGSASSGQQALCLFDCPSCPWEHFGPYCSPLDASYCQCQLNPKPFPKGYASQPQGRPPTTLCLQVLQVRERSQAPAGHPQAAPAAGEEHHQSQGPALLLPQGCAGHCSRPGRDRPGSGL